MENVFYQNPWYFILVLLAVVLLMTVIVRIYINNSKLIFERKQRGTKALMEQTIEALASAVDAKDSYTNGHSRRVADYSRKIAREIGKSKDECEEIYFAALLHDVGKIGVPDNILTKTGRLTDEEYSQIKQHSTIGGQILSSIAGSPYLSIAARHHHERYDGRGYPDGLKGEDIPEIARIIAVADAYDAMSSNRSYRDAIPQHIIREELVKGMGTQFDPEFARTMIHLLDLDEEYHMRETSSVPSLSPDGFLRCESVYNDCTEGIRITGNVSHIRFFSHSEEGYSQTGSLPVLILFDALDAKVHPGEENNKDLLYFEYAKIRIDGRISEGEIRKTEMRIYSREPEAPVAAGDRIPGWGKRYDIEAVKYRDHALIRIFDEEQVTEVIMALRDSSRFLYISISGEHCAVSGIKVDMDDVSIESDYIPRIADEISYIRGCPEGDVPNVQVNNWCSEATEGILLKDGTEMVLSFHGMSLPTARLVWHCPYVTVFTSDDGHFKGEGFREYMLFRLDGENWDSDEHVDNQLNISRQQDFGGWNEWKEKNKEGLDCTVRIQRDNNIIKMDTENLGIAINSLTTIHDEVEHLYAAITGDQVAISNVHVLESRIVQLESGGIEA